jgi:transposase-like protein
MLRTDLEGMIDERTIELIAQRVIIAIRADMEAITNGLSTPTTTEQLTVGQVARQLGVARSTVYAHWREWGGYKLGTGDKAPIRFDISTLAAVRQTSEPHSSPAIQSTSLRTRKRGARRRDLLTDAPRLDRASDRLG